MVKKKDNFFIFFKYAMIKKVALESLDFVIMTNKPNHIPFICLGNADVFSFVLPTLSLVIYERASFTQNPILPKILIKA